MFAGYSDEAYASKGCEIKSRGDTIDASQAGLAWMQSELQPRGYHPLAINGCGKPPFCWFCRLGHFVGQVFLTMTQVDGGKESSRKYSFGQEAGESQSKPRVDEG